MMKSVSTPVTHSAPPEVIKDAVKADASAQKANPENRIGKSSVASKDIRTSGYGVDDDVVTSKKKLLGE